MLPTRDIVCLLLLAAALVGLVLAAVRWRSWRLLVWGGLALVLLSYALLPSPRYLSYHGMLNLGIHSFFKNGYFPPTANAGHLAACLAVAVVLAAILMAVLRTRRWGVLLLVGPLPALALYLTLPAARLLSMHGLIHTGLVYYVANGQIPPDCPYMAGEPIGYPWTYHVLVAWLGQTLQVAPPWVFATLNLVCLVLFMFSWYQVARHWYDAASAVLATFLGLFGSSFTLITAIGTHDLERRVFPLYQKFLNTNIMPLGLVLFAPAVLCLLYVLKGQGRSLPWYAVLAVLLVLEALVYPIVWLGLVITSAAAAMVLLLLGDWHRSMTLGLVVALSSASVYPYLHSLTQAKDPEASLGLSTHPGEHFRNALAVALGLLPLWVLLAMGRRQLWALLRGRSRLHWFAVFVVLFTFTTWIFLYVPDNAGYKIMALGMLFLALLAAPGLARVKAGNPLELGAVLCLLLLPVGHEISARAQWFTHVDVGAREVGFTLHPQDPAEDELYQYIRTSTPRDAVCIDDNPNLPVLGWRAVYVACPPAGRGINGWLYTNEEWLHKVHGYSREQIARRLQVVQGLYEGPESMSDADVMAALRPLHQDRPLYVVSHSPAQTSKLALRPFLHSVAAGDTWAVFRYDPEKADAGPPAVNEVSHEDGRQ
jgi:hypothetical protein